MHVYNINISCISHFRQANHLPTVVEGSYESASDHLYEIIDEVVQDEKKVEVIVKGPEACKREEYQGKEAERKEKKIMKAASKEKEEEKKKLEEEEEEPEEEEEGGKR